MLTRKESSDVTYKIELFYLYIISDEHHNIEFIHNRMYTSDSRMLLIYWNVIDFEINVNNNDSKDMIIPNHSSSTK